MVITNKNEQLHYLNKILKEKHQRIYRMRPDGLLEYDGNGVTETFLAFINGKWYGSRAGRKDSSDKELEQNNKKKFLFAITEYRYFSMLENKTVEYASPAKHLSQNTAALLMAIHHNTLCIYIIDGSKYPQPLMIGVPAEYDSKEIFALSIISLVRQYDPEAATQMNEFWFHKEVESNAEDNNEDLFTIMKQQVHNRTYISPHDFPI